MRLPRQETSGPRPGVLVVLVALSIVLITVWFRESESGPLHRVRAATHAVTAPASYAGEVITRPVRAFFAWAGDLGVSRSELEQLRSQNESLRARVAELEEARLENERLRALVQLPQVAEIESKAARIIGRPTSSWEDVFTIDLGSDDGIGAGMPVVGPEGLIGQTIAVTGSTARVRLITDQRSGVAALIQRNRAGGVVRGSIEGRLGFDFVSRETTVQSGDVVITSGLGGVYPKGIVIGEVTQVRRAGSLFQEIDVEPAGDIAGLEEVVVLVGQSAKAAPETGE